MWRVSVAILALVGAGGTAHCRGCRARTVQNILAAQLRDQGYTCDQPQSAERDVQASTPDGSGVGRAMRERRIRHAPRSDNGGQGGAARLAVA